MNGAGGRPPVPSGPLDDGAPLVLRSAYPAVVAGMCALVIVSNVAAVKLVGVGPLTFDGGALVFPLTYILGDVVAEVWGLRAARRAIAMGLCAMVVATAVWWIVELVPPAPGWYGQEAYVEVLGFVPRIVAACLAGYATGQLANAWVLVRVKKAMAGRALWVRLIVSTLVGEAADTAVFCTVAFYGVIVGGQFAGYVVAGYLYKCVAEVVCLPVTYAVVRRLRCRERGLAAG